MRSLKLSSTTKKLTAGQWLKLIVALLLLNGFLSMTSLWPTVAVVPDARIAPEFILTVVLVSLVLAFKGKLGSRLLSLFSIAYGLLILGRYLDVVGPSAFGRPVSLYWDLPQIPRFLWVTATGSPWWLTLAVAMFAIGLLWAAHRGLLTLFKVLETSLAVWSRSMVWWLLLLLLTGVAAANYAGVQATWPYVSKPVVPTYWKELVFLRNSYDTEKVAQLLPAQTVVESVLEADSPGTLAVLRNRDFYLIFLESYGATLYDNEQQSKATSSTRALLESSIAASDHSVVSAFYTSPTVGGGSDLAHMSLLSGIDLKNPRRHDLLLTTNRPNLFKVFQKRGYEVFGVYPSVFWDWPERVFYGFDRYFTGLDIEYSGPEFGFWKVPDQYVLAYLEEKFPRIDGQKPRLTMLSTMSTHFPFVPTPPYQPDWKRLLGPNPYDQDEVDKAYAEEVNWLNMQPAFLSTINYANKWLAGYFAQEQQGREAVYLLLGDHQPTATISGENAPWDVPVFVVSKDQDLLEKFRQIGFSDGLTPDSRKPLGGLHDLTNHLLKQLSTP